MYPKQTFLINFLHFFDKHPNTQNLWNVNSCCALKDLYTYHTNRTGHHAHALFNLNKLITM
jgi:hypothetical protein